jgi:hypothetical protein
MNRREILKMFGLGAGGLVLAPLLTRIARAGGAPARRFVFVVEGNGFEPVTMLSNSARAAIDARATAPIGEDRWWPDKAGHETTLDIPGDLASASALGALAGSADVPSLLPHAAVVLGLSSRIVNGGHSAEHGVLSSTRTIAGVAGGTTIDALLASLAQVRAEAPFDAVRLGVAPDVTKALDFGTCAFDRGASAPLILQPKAAHDLLFGSVASAAGQRAFTRRNELLDFAAADVRAALAAFSGTSVERAKLEAYLASLEVLSARQSRIIALRDTLAAARPTDPSSDARYESESVFERLGAQLDVAAAALIGGLTHVCVVGCGTGGDFNVSYPADVAGESRHVLHHGSGADATLAAQIHDITRRQVDLVASLARRLLAVPEDGGTMLDHTVIVYIGDNGEQHHSQALEFPVLLLGGRALGLRTGGRSVVYPGVRIARTHRQLSNLWNTLGHLAGIELNAFGREGPNRIAEGPLSELMV